MYRQPKEGDEMDMKRRNGSGGFFSALSLSIAIHLILLSIVIYMTRSVESQKRSIVKSRILLDLNKIEALPPKPASASSKPVKPVKPPTPPVRPAKSVSDSSSQERADIEPIPELMPPPLPSTDDMKKSVVSQSEKSESSKSADMKRVETGIGDTKGRDSNETAKKKKSEKKISKRESLDSDGVKRESRHKKEKKVDKKSEVKKSAKSHEKPKKKKREVVKKRERKKEKSKKAEREKKSVRRPSPAYGGVPISTHKRIVHRPTGPDSGLIDSLYGSSYSRLSASQRRFIDRNLRKIIEISQRTLNYLGYPTEAVRFRQQGTNVVQFWLYPNGDISGLRLKRRTGSSALDRQTIEVIKTAYMYYPRPKVKTKIVIYVRYRLY
jgi:TonB family protein